MTTASAGEFDASRTSAARTIVRDIVDPGVALPTLTSRRFRFRPFTLADIRKLVAIAGQDQVGITSIGVPHPYSTEFARIWSPAAAATGSLRSFHWAATKFGDPDLSGYAGLNKVDRERRQAELRVWVGSSGEHSSYAAEWSASILQFALIEANLERIYALQLARHPIAGRVLSSIGMHRDGVLRRRMHRDGPFEEVICWAILKEEWHAGRS